MIASVASTAPTVRPSAEGTAAKQRLDAAKTAQTQQAAAASPEEPAAVVSISKQGAEQATARSEPAQAATEPTATAAADSTPKSNKPALAYEAADTDQDGKISAFEQKSYDFRHPAALKAYTELAASAVPKDAAAAITGKPTEAPGSV